MTDPEFRQITGDEGVSPAVEPLQRQEMVTAGEQRQQGGGDGGHAAGGDDRRLARFQRSQLGMEGVVIGSVVEADVANRIVALLARGFEGGRLENGYAHRPLDSRFGLTGVDRERGQPPIQL